MKKLLPALLAALLVAACGSTPKTEGPAKVEDRTATSGGATNGDVKTIEATGTDGALRKKYPELYDPKNVLSKRSVYFDFDSYVIKDEYKPLVEAHAKFVRDHSDVKMLIQGNTDERGSREYNLALGQKRAEAVRRAMATLGAKDAQVEAVSLGEEKPKNAGHDESAWAENRRADITYVGE